jgi:hypothetical protein
MFSLPGPSEDEKSLPTEGSDLKSLDTDLSTYHENCIGRLVLDPRLADSFSVSLLLRMYFVLLTTHLDNSEARIEFGDKIASRLKLSPDGKTVLWPQPTDDPEDPQNVRLHLFRESTETGEQ